MLNFKTRLLFGIPRLGELSSFFYIIYLSLCGSLLTYTAKALMVGDNQSHHHEPAYAHGRAGCDHTHGTLDPSLLASEKGIWAVKWSLLILVITTVLQATVVAFTSSVALLADTIHNFGDAATAIPLWVAFVMARKPPTKRFSYGYGRVEDLAGIIIVLLMLVSGVIAAYTSISGLFQPQEIHQLFAVATASLLGFTGNELVARFRLRVGKEIGSAALVADGHHARTDAFTSLGVLLGAVGVWLGYPQADPVVGLVITGVIFKIVWESGKSLCSRLLDGVDPEVIDEVTHSAQHVPEVLEVTEVRVRWIGHRLLGDVNISIQSDLTVEQGHEIAREVRHQLLHHLPYLANVTIHVDPATASGERHHLISDHTHDQLPTHSH
jgi:cation diffusion facilitator family transporter